MRVPVTHLEDPEIDMPTKRPVLARLTPKNRVRLTLSLIAYEEALEFFGDAIERLGRALDATPWAAVVDLGPATAVYLLLDLHKTYLEPHALAYPRQVKLLLSRAEACLLWKTWAASEVAPAQAPAYAAVMEALHQLLA